MNLRNASWLGARYQTSIRGCVCRLSYLFWTSYSKRALGRPRGFIPDEALDRDRALLQGTAVKDAG